jgi:integration host factor subunit beta
MVKSELIYLIAQRMTEKRQDLPLEDVEMSVNQVLEYLSETLSQNGRIEIRGFGSFNLHYRPPRNAHNPKTGEKLATEAKYMPHFKAGKDLRDRVNQMGNVDK